MDGLVINEPLVIINNYVNKCMCKNTKCMMCKTEDISSVFSKCGHMCLCTDCIIKTKGKCPKCKPNPPSPMYKNNKI